MDEWIASIVLASSSPRRRELLANCGMPFRIDVPDCDETPVAGEGAEAMVRRLALLKAKVVAERHPDSYVLGADTTVFIDDEALGKPESPADAERMLGRISGRTHEVWGGFAWVNLARGVEHVEAHRSSVTMTEITPAERARYVATGEPLDKAGAYAIQGIGLQFVERISGSYSNVVGLDIAAVRRALLRLPGSHRSGLP